jgi:hypothetical protein
MNENYVKDMKELEGETEKAMAYIVGAVEMVSDDDDSAIKLDAYEKIIDVLEFYWYGKLLTRPHRAHLYE